MESPFNKLKPVFSLPNLIGQLVFNKLNEFMPVDMDEFNEYIAERAAELEQ